jgi:hypothetical protein
MYLTHGFQAIKDETSMDKKDMKESRMVQSALILQAVFNANDSAFYLNSFSASKNAHLLDLNINQSLINRFKVPS